MTFLPSLPYASLYYFSAPSATYVFFCGPCHRHYSLLYLLYSWDGTYSPHWYHYDMLGVDVKQNVCGNRALWQEEKCSALSAAALPQAL